MPSGGAKATIRVVAERSGVSTTTVSRVMQDPSFGSTGTRQRVLKAAAELGWVPNGAARGLASHKAGIVGLLFPDLGQSGAAEEQSPLYVDEVIRGAEKVATLAGEAVLIAAVRAAPRRALAYSVAGKVDGLVIMARSLSDKDITAIARSVPVVLLAAKPGRRSLDHVAVDNRAGARELVAHLIEAHGYRDLVFVSGPAGSPDSAERFAGFCEALAAAGIPQPALPVAEGGFTQEGGAKAMRSLLNQGRRARAVVFGNDEMAIGALGVLREAGLRVPGDIAVTGFDDIAIARHVSPPLTTVHQPMRELGEQAVQLLFSRLREPTSSRRAVLLSTHLVVRESCGCTGKSQPQAGRRER